MTGNKGIAVAFAGLRKARHAAKLAQIRKIATATGQQLMNIGLVTNIEHQSVFFRIVYSFQGDTQLHNTKVGGQVAASLRYAMHQEMTNLVAKLLPLILGEFQKILMAGNGIQ